MIPKVRESREIRSRGLKSIHIVGWKDADSFIKQIMEFLIMAQPSAENSRGRQKSSLRSTANRTSTLFPAKVLPDRRFR